MSEKAGVSRFGVPKTTGQKMAEGPAGSPKPLLKVAHRARRRACPALSGFDAQSRRGITKEAKSK